MSDIKDQINVLDYELEDTLTTFDFIVELLGDLLASDDNQQILGNLTNKLSNYLQSKYAIFLIKENDELKVFSHTGFSGDKSFTQPQKLERSLCYCVHDLGSSLVVPEVVTDSRFDESELFPISEPTSVIARCLAQGEVYGVFLFYFSPQKNLVLTRLHDKLTSLLNIYQVHFFNQIKRIAAQSEKKEVQKELFLAAKLASIGGLAAGLAHEINNPLAIALGYMEDFETQFPKLYSQSQKPIQSIKEALGRIAEIVKNVKNFSHSEEQMDNINVHDATLKTLKLIGSIYRKDNVNIETNLAAAQFTVYGNLGKLQQAIMNLISNARDALLSKSGGTIRIETANEGKNLIFKIKDNGCGIEKKNLDKIFITFFTTKGVGQGTGLGLTITQDIIKEMNGSITVESEIGVGTTFTLRIPAVEKVEPEQVARSTSMQQAQLSGKVLVVDDEESLLDILRKMLQKFGLTVDVAANGAVALEQISKANYDLIMTDLRMPLMNGDDLIRRASTIVPKNTRFILITGSTEYNIEDLQEQKSVKVLNKPFTRQTVYEAVKECFPRTN